jgi:antitoxin component YwqK of YwqJK toxin-antitoxin module
MRLLRIDGRTVSRIAILALTVFGLQLAGRAAEAQRLKTPYAFSPTPADEGPQATDITSSGAAGAIGELETVRERYDDGKVKIERQVTLDADGNYVNHGEWKMLSRAGDVVAEGHFDMGKRIGTWTRWHGRQDSPELNEFPFNRFKTPFQAQANFVNDEMEGEWLITDSAQQKCMQVSLVGGKRNGQVITWLPSGKVYRQSTYENGVPVGDVLEVDNKSGELKTAANYVDGRKAVTKTTYFHHGRQKMTEASFLAATTVERSPDDFWNLRLAQYGSEGNDLRHGPSKTWFENGVVQQEGSYQYDKKCGPFTYRYENGQVAVTGEYKDDAPDDVWVWWHENGQKAAIGKYNAGAMLGEWRWWNEDGKLADTKTYDGTQQAGTDPKDVIKTGRAPNSQQTR